MNPSVPMANEYFEGRLAEARRNLTAMTADIALIHRDIEKKQRYMAGRERQRGCVEQEIDFYETHLSRSDTATATPSPQDAPPPSSAANGVPKAGTDAVVIASKNSLESDIKALLDEEQQRQHQQQQQQKQKQQQQQQKHDQKTPIPPAPGKPTNPTSGPSSLQNADRDLPALGPAPNAHHAIVCRFFANSPRGCTSTTCPYRHVWWSSDDPPAQIEHWERKLRAPQEQQQQQRHRELMRRRGSVDGERKEATAAVDATPNGSGGGGGGGGGYDPRRGAVGKNPKGGEAGVRMPTFRREGERERLVQELDDYFKVTGRG